MRTGHRLTLSALGLLALLGAARGPAAAGKERTFRFTYQATVREIPGSARQVDVWVPVPQTDPNQTIASVRIEAPAPVELIREPEHGNSILHMRITDPQRTEIPIRLEITATRRENAGLRDTLAAAERRRYLQPDRLVPLDGRIRALAREVTQGKRTDMEKARAIYEYVTSNVKYDKSGTGWGRGDALWVCDEKRGNCTDFHALLIGMARASGIPARFSIGFPLPEQRGEGEIPGYHCWAEVYVDGRWIPIDSSEAAKNPAKRAYFFGHHDENRIEFTTGRDLRFQPAPQQGPLNYMVYPVVEVDGQPHAGVERKFAFADRSPLQTRRP